MIDLTAAINNTIAETTHKKFRYLFAQIEDANKRITKNTLNLQTQISQLREVLERTTQVKKCKDQETHRAGESWGDFEDNQFCTAFDEFLASEAKKHGRSVTAMSARFGKHITSGRIKLQWFSNTSCGE